MFKFFKDNGELCDEAYDVNVLLSSRLVNAAIINLKTKEVVGFVKGELKYIVEAAKKEKRAVIDSFGYDEVPF